MQKIILASQSPRRKEILELVKIPFEIKTENTLEEYPDDILITDVPSFLAELKANAVFKKLNEEEQDNYIIIASDTIVVIDNKVIGKPQSEKEAIEILNKLSDNVHYVITGVCLKSKTKTHIISDTSEVSFRKLSQEQIEFYVKNYKPFDKAGAYAIQEWIGAVGIEKINGDYYSIMGLPVSKVIVALAEEFGDLTIR